MKNKKSVVETTPKTGTYSPVSEIEGYIRSIGKDLARTVERQIGYGKEFSDTPKDKITRERITLDIVCDPEEYLTSIFVQMRNSCIGWTYAPVPEEDDVIYHECLEPEYTAAINIWNMKEKNA